MPCTRWAASIGGTCDPGPRSGQLRESLKDQRVDDDESCMSTLIGEARARLLGYADGNDRAPGPGAPSMMDPVLPPMDEVQIRVEHDSYADPFALGNEGGFDLVWGDRQPIDRSITVIESTREREYVPPSPEATRAIGRLWTNFASSDVAKAALAQLAG